MGDLFHAEVNEAIEYVTKTFIKKGFDLIEVKEEKKLNERFQMLRAMLNDSEKMEITSETAKLSLKNLKRIFYEIEDLLDEFLYHILDLRSDIKPSTTDETIIFLGEMAKRACELNAELEPIEKEWTRVSRNLKLEAAVHFQSTSLPDGKDNLIGRADSFDKIKNLLFSKCKQGKNVEVIALVGMGGIGKTKLVSSLFNNGSIEDYFDMKIWVCVSEDFSVESLTSAMLDNLGNYTPYRVLDTKQRGLRENVQGKRVLLVLDDVWKVNNLSHTSWEDVLKPFNFSNEAKIIVTTRSEEVLETIGKPDEIYHLPYLSDDDCFEIFKYHAFSARESGSYPIFLELGEEISKKCRGVPLAAKSLGRLLRNQDNTKQWHEVLNNQSVCAEDRDVISILHLSYQYLPVVLKKCFRYCSVFPKGCQLSKKQLVNMWLANGFLTISELEDIGEKYVNELLSYSLLERDGMSEMFFTMHDMIHDLARSVSSDEWSSVEGDMLHGHRNDGFQHFSIISAESYPQELVEQKLKSRSLLVFNSTLIWPDVKDMCKKMKNLRVLDMTHSGLRGILLELLGSLKHLRFLSLQDNAVTVLPESMGKLHFLETLNLNGTKIEVFPDFICSLKRLRFLDLRGTPIKFLPESLGQLDQLLSLDLEFCKIDRLPDSISNMSCLRHLTCNGDVVFPLSMRKFTHLPIIKEITDTDVGRGLYKNNKEQVKVLYLKWIEDGSFERHEEMLELSKDHHNVKQLCMEEFRGSYLPSHLNEFLRYLSVIQLINCESLESLYLQNVKFLRHLHINSARSLKYIFMPVRQSQNMSQSLTILDCPSLKTISSSDDLIAINVLQLTRCPEFYISCRKACHSLQNLSIIESLEGTNFYLGSPKPDKSELKDLSIHDYPTVISHSPSNDTNDYFSQSPQLQVLRLGNLSFIRHLCIQDSRCDIPYEFSNGRFQKLETLVFENLHGWTSWEGPKEGQCQKLQRIRIVNCAKVQVFSLSYRHEIKELHVEECPWLSFNAQWKQLLRIEKLYVNKIAGPWLIVYGYEKPPLQNDRFLHSRLWNVSGARHLIMGGCDWLKFISTKDLPADLQAIQIHNCSAITDIYLDNQISLKYLSIFECSSFSTLSCGSSKLRFLEIINCSRKNTCCSMPSLEHLEYLCVGHSVVLKLSSANLLLSSLKVMEIQWPTFSIVRSMHPHEKKLVIMELEDMIPRFKYLRKMRILLTSLDLFESPTVEFLKSLPLTLQLLEIIGPHWECNKMQLPLQGLSIQQLTLKDFSYGCSIEFPSTLKVLEIINCKMIEMLNYIPSTLRRLSIIRCPDMEIWCERNKDELRNVYITYEEEEGHKAHTTCSLLPFIRHSSSPTLVQTIHPPSHLIVNN